jgi:hypothetical protein
MQNLEVRIEYGTRVSIAQVPALPRKGDRISCSFPHSGIPMLYLVVKDVWFHEPPEAKFDERRCLAPFSITVTTDDDPDPELKARNVAVMKHLVPGSGTRAH